MKESIFVLGGCRSGKSRHALELAEQIPGRKYFIATCVPHDDEMKERVLRHQQERSREWETVETPLFLPETIIEKSGKADVILVDCLTLWVTNLILEPYETEQIYEHIKGLADSVKKAKCTVILVSNEVGAGIVPENRLARLFRDIVGYTNQAMASCADRVVWTVAGIPMTVKSRVK